MVSDIQASPTWADQGNSKEEAVIYYRRRNGWITWGDTQPSKQIIMLRKGATPLPQYGNITASEDLWGPILRNGGAHEFPVEQVLTYRWYRKDMLPDLRPIQQVGRTMQRVGAQPKVVFPQLVGVKITEFPCPEPCNRTFHSPLHLGGHLRVMHEYDRSEILKYGEAMNIDFTKIPGGKAIVEYDGPTALEAAEEVVEDAEFEVTSVSAAAPATAEVAGTFEEGSVMAAPSNAPRHDCPDCGWVNGKNTAQGLAMHKRKWCK